METRNAMVCNVVYRAGSTRKVSDIRVRFDNGSEIWLSRYEDCDINNRRIGDRVILRKCGKDIYVVVGQLIF